MTEQIIFSEIKKTYGKKTVFENLTFSIKEKEKVALIGNNGEGKTTIINLMLNITSFDNGKIIINSETLTPESFKYKMNLGAMPSDSYLIEEFSTIEYLYFVAKFKYMDSKTYKERIASLLNLFNIEKEKSTLIRELSQGNKKKVAFISCILNDPKILLLDEPFVHFDINTIEKVINYFKNETNGKTVLISSHNLDYVLNICNRFIILKNGRITKDIYRENKSNEELSKIIKNEIVEINQRIL